MKTVSTIQEILLMTTSTFAKKQLCELNSPERRGPVNPAEQLEEACWNGLLDELLDGIIERTASGKRLCLWHTQQRASFLEIELCEDLQFTERYLSINPYNFLSVWLQN